MIGFNENQIDFMKKHKINYNNFLEISNKVYELLMKRGFDDDYNPTNIGIMCESILDTLADIDQ